jgi:hypothetical protein
MALAPSCCLAGGLPCPALEAGGPERYARWGDQLDVRNITRDDQAGELSAEQVAGYIAKYATKATELRCRPRPPSDGRRRPRPPGQAAGAHG